MRLDAVTVVAPHAFTRRKRPSAKVLDRLDMRISIGRAAEAGGDGGAGMQRLARFGGWSIEPPVKFRGR